MTSISSLPSSALLAGDTTPKPKDAAEAAQQFEALLLTQVLQSVQPEVEGGEKDPGKDTLWSMAAQQFSQMLAQRGGLGLARLITERLASPPAESTPRVPNFSRKL